MLLNSKDLGDELLRLWDFQIKRNLKKLVFMWQTPNQLRVFCSAGQTFACGKIAFWVFQIENKFFPASKETKLSQNALLELETTTVRRKRTSEDAVTRGGLRLWGPWLKLWKGPFLIYKTVVNREKINERTEVLVLLKRKKLEQKKRIVN